MYIPEKVLKVLRINYLLEQCIFFSIILAIFDGLNIRAGLLQQGHLYPTLIGIIGYIFIAFYKKNKIYVCNTYKIYIIFIIYILISIVLNLNNILGTEFKGFSAEDRVISNYFVLIFIGIMLVVMYNILLKKQGIIFWIYKAFLYGFYITSLYAVIQLMGMFDITVANDIYHTVEPYINIQFNTYEMTMNVRRVIGFAKEGSCFGNYISIIFPWLIIGALYLKKEKKAIYCCFLAIILVIFSYSRIAYGTIFLEVFSMIIMLNRFRKNLFSIKCGVFLFVIVSCLGYYILNIDSGNSFDKITGVFLSFSDEAEEGRISSNLTRLGLQVAAVGMFIDNPIIGLGLAQFQFNVVEYLPLWSYLSPEIQEVVNPGNRDVFYGAFNTHLRILAETGIFGFLLWISLMVFGLKNYTYVLSNVKKENRDIIKLIILSYIASFVAFMNFDTFDVFWYWILLVLSDVLVYKMKREKEEFL